MATYIAKNALGEQVNMIEILPAQIPSWEALTGLILELPSKALSGDISDQAIMEIALNKLGVRTE